MVAEDDFRNPTLKEIAGRLEQALKQSAIRYVFDTYKKTIRPLALRFPCGMF